MYDEETFNAAHQAAQQQAQQAQPNLAPAPSTSAPAPIRRPLPAPNTAGGSSLPIPDTRSLNHQRRHPNETPQSSRKERPSWLEEANLGPSSESGQGTSTPHVVQQQHSHHHQQPSANETPQPSRKERPSWLEEAGLGSSSGSGQGTSTHHAVPQEHSHHHQQSPSSAILAEDDRDLTADNILPPFEPVGPSLEGPAYRAVDGGEAASSQPRIGNPSPSQGGQSYQGYAQQQPQSRPHVQHPHPQHHMSMPPPPHVRPISNLGHRDRANFTYVPPPKPATNPYLLPGAYPYAHADSYTPFTGENNASAFYR